MVRESLPSYSNGLWPNLTAGRPTRLSVLATALHLPMVGYLTGKKRLWASPTHTAVGRFFLRPAAGHLRTAFILRCAAGDDEARHAGGAFLFQGMGAGFQGCTSREDVVSKVFVFDTIER